MTLTPRPTSLRTALLAAALLLPGCTPQVVKEEILPPPAVSSPSAERGNVVRTQGDTVSYVLEFPDAKDRKAFVAELNAFIKNHPFSPIEADTVNHYVKLRVTPAPAPLRRPETLAKPQQPPVTPPALPVATVPGALDTGYAYGGSAAIYTPRGFLDDALLPLVSSDWQPAPGAAGLYFTIDSSSQRRLKLSLADKLTNAAGQALTAFDIVGAWTSFVKSHPAEGTALFGRVKGLAEFIQGKEAIIPGMQIVDERTIQFNLQEPDPLMPARLRTRRLLPQSLKLGPYAVGDVRDNQLLLAANRQFPPGRPYLDKCTVRLGKDANPFLGYSLNRYTIVAVVNIQDIAYAKERLLESSTLVPLAEDRYFLALAADPPDLRRFVRDLVKPDDLLAHFVKAEGTVISAVEQEAPGQPAQAAPQAAFKTAPAVQKPLAILFRDDDPSSALIASKLLADLTRVGVACALRPSPVTAYERSLVNRDYSIAVGWAPQGVLQDESERLRLASVWFGGERDEPVRLRSGAELPLFTVRQYALCKKNVAFHQGLLAGVYLKP